MAVGIIIHITAGTEKRTEFFSDERIRVGSDETSDLQIHAPQLTAAACGLIWKMLTACTALSSLMSRWPACQRQSDPPLYRDRRWRCDCDTDADISFSFFSLETKSSLITTNRDQPHISRFIEDAALESAGSAKRDDAKCFYANSCVNFPARYRGRAS